MVLTDCYFCVINLKGINFKNKYHVQYPDVPSTIRPIPHGPELLVPEPDGNMEYSSYSKYSDMSVVLRDDAYKSKENNQSVTFGPSGTQLPNTNPEPF